MREGGRLVSQSKNGASLHMENKASALLVFKERQYFVNREFPAVADLGRSV